MYKYLSFSKILTKYLYLIFIFLSSFLENQIQWDVDIVEFITTIFAVSGNNSLVKDITQTELISILLDVRVCIYVYTYSI